MNFSRKVQLIKILHSPKIGRQPQWCSGPPSGFDISWSVNQFGRCLWLLEGQVPHSIYACPQMWICKVRVKGHIGIQMRLNDQPGFLCEFWQKSNASFTWKSKNLLNTEGGKIPRKEDAAVSFMPCIHAVKNSPVVAMANEVLLLQYQTAWKPSN